jgi:hypothetical protein
LNIYDYGSYYSYTAGGTVHPSPNTIYSENSGISEVITDTSVNYSLSTSGNGYHFVAKCYQSKILDATRYIFRSKSFRYDTFDWTTDLLIMPEPITALHFYEGKLWAFSNNKTYRIDPDGMYIEDVFEDAGALGQRSVHSNEFGMFFGNKLNAWMYRDGSFYPIGDAIRQSVSGKSWRSTFLYTNLLTLIVTSDAKKGYVLFINERTVNETNRVFAWAYHPSKKRWDAFGFGDYASGGNAGIIKGKDGQVYYSNATKTYELMRAASYQAWEWYSQKLSFGETRQKKSMSMIKLDSTGTVAITYGVDNATPATSGTSEALINVYNKSIKIKLSANSGDNYVRSMEVLYRPLLGKR